MVTTQLTHTTGTYKTTEPTESQATVVDNKSKPPNYDTSEVTGDVTPSQPSGQPYFTDYTDETPWLVTSLRTPYPTTPAADITMIVEVNGVACACIRIYSPVCGTDNKSYFNPCLLACEHGNDNPKVTVAYDGNCIPW